jgi:hypothetical protein
MNTLPPPLRIANTAAVLDGTYGAVTRQAARCGTSRKALYRDASKVLQAVDGSDSRQRLQELHDDNDRLHAERDRLHRQLQQTVVLDADRLARFAATAQAEGVSLPVARRLLLSLSGPAALEAVTRVRQVLRQAWRASSLVECLNSVARMQQSRHRRMTPGLLALKRLYWNCRTFRTGRRRQQTPYGLLGVQLPTTDWWELLQLSPEQLCQQLSAPGVAA